MSLHKSGCDTYIHTLDEVQQSKLFLQQYHLGIDVLDAIFVHLKHDFFLSKHCCSLWQWMNLHDFGHGTDANILDEVQRSKFLIEHIRWGLPPFYTPLLVAVVYLHEQNLTRRRVRVPPWLSIHNKQKILSNNSKTKRSPGYSSIRQYETPLSFPQSALPMRLAPLRYFLLHADHVNPEEF